MRRALLLAALLGFASPAAAQQEPSEFYPALAAQQGVSGTVTLDCLVGDDGRVACEVAEETPEYWEFGDAALAASRHWRVSPNTTNGQSTGGGRLRRALVFEAGPPVRIRHETRRRNPTPAP